MKQITVEEFKKDIDFYIKEAKDGKVFIYPTDTIYWLWCIAKQADKIYKIKKREKKKPFSVIAPNIQRIKNNMIVYDNIPEEIDKFFKQYHWITLLLIKKDKKFLTQISDNEKIGVRILKHEFQNFVEKLWEPFITTSVNLTWEKSINEISQIDEDFKKNIDYIIDWWKMDGRPSVIIDVEKNDIIMR